MKRVQNDYQKNLVNQLKVSKRLNAYLAECLRLSIEDGNGQTFQLALRIGIEVKGGMSKFSKKIKMKRPNIYRVLATDSKPTFDSILEICKGLEFKI